MKQEGKKERSIKFLEILRKILIFIFISIPVVSVVMLIRGINSVESTDDVIIPIIVSSLLEMICFGGLVNEIEWLIRKKYLSIENDRQCEIVINELNSIKKEYVEIFPKSYDVFGKAQKIRDEDGIDIRFYAKVISSNAIQITCLLFIGDYGIEFDKAILVNNFLYFNKNYFIK